MLCCLFLYFFHKVFFFHKAYIINNDCLHKQYAVQSVTCQSNLVACSCQFFKNQNNWFIFPYLNSNNTWLIWYIRQLIKKNQAYSECVLLAGARRTCVTTFVTRARDGHRYQLFPSFLTFSFFILSSSDANSGGGL